MDCISHIDVQQLGHGETCFLVDAFGRPADPEASSIFDDYLFGSDDIDEVF